MSRVVGCGGVGAPSGGDAQTECLVFAVAELCAEARHRRIVQKKKNLLVGCARRGTALVVVSHLGMLPQPDSLQRRHRFSIRWPAACFRIRIASGKGSLLGKPRPALAISEDARNESGAPQKKRLFADGGLVHAQERPKAGGNLRDVDRREDSLF